MQYEPLQEHVGAPIPKYWEVGMALCEWSPVSLQKALANVNLHC